MHVFQQQHSSYSDQTIIKNGVLEVLDLKFEDQNSKTMFPDCFETEKLKEIL